jgi:Cohesin domain/Secretion system C-terminal sorting domain/HYR domain
MTIEQLFIISQPIYMKQRSSAFRHSCFQFPFQTFYHMNIATLQQRLCSLLAIAFMLIAQTPIFGCGVTVSGSQPIVVNVYLDPITGDGMLSGSNIMAFVQGTGVGCSVYNFHDDNQNDVSSFLGNSIMYNCTDVGNFTLFVRMDDDGIPGNGSESNFVLLNVTVHDLTTPTVTCPANATYETNDDGNESCSMSVTGNALQLTWLDNCGIPEYKINAGIWTPGDNVAPRTFPKGVTNVSYRVLDGSGHSASCAFTVTVTDADAPHLVGLPNILDTVSGNVPFSQILATYATSTVTAIDSCDGARPVVYSVETDTFSVANCPILYQITRHWETTDLSGNTASATQFVSVIDTFAPVLAYYATDTTIFTLPNDLNCEAEFEIFPLDFAIDLQPDDSLEVTYFLNGNLVTSLDAFYGVALSPYNMTAIIADQCGNQDTIAFVLNVEDATPPIASCVTSLNLALTPAGTVNLLPQFLNQSSLDNCSPTNQLSFIAAPNNFDCSHIGIPQTVTLFVFDPLLNFASCISTVNIQDNTEPTLVCPADQTFNCTIDETIAGVPVASDACGTVTIVKNESILTQTGPNCFVMERKYTATDLHNNTSVCFQILTIEDNFAPILLNVPNDTIIDCGTVLANPVVISFDTCDGSHTVIPTIQVLAGANCTVDKIKTYQVRTWESTDACGNLAITTDTIRFRDIVAPNISSVPLELTFYSNQTTCDGEVEIDLNDYAIFDECGGIVTLTPATFSSTEPIGDLTLFYSAEDACGNISNGEILVHVEDNTAPSVVCQTEITVALDGTGFHQLTQNELLISTSDNCGIGQIIMNPPFVNCGNANAEELGFGPTNVNLIVGDVNGNINTCPVIVHVIAPDSLDVTIAAFSTTSPSFIGGNDGAASIDVVSGGSGSYNYTFSDENFIPFWYQSSVSMLSAGLYYAIVEDNATSCLDVVEFFLQDGQPPVLTADTVSGANGAIVCVPVTVENFQNIVSVQMDISVPDASVGQIISVTNFQSNDFDLAVPSPISNNFTVSMLSNPLGQVDLMNGDTLFCINIELVGSLFDTTSVTIVDGSVELVTGSLGNFDTLTSINFDGFVAINSGAADAEIAGNVRTFYGTNVALVAVDLNGGTPQTTNASGDFSFQTPIGDPCVLTPSKDINYVNGVDVLDLFTIQRHILGEPLALQANPYRYIAADANNDKSITTFDLVELQYIVLNPVNADISGNNSWRFVPATWNFATPNNPWSLVFPEMIDLGIVLTDSLQNNFIGIKVGDVNEDVDVLNAVDANDRSPFFFSINDRAVSAGELVAIPVRAKDFNDKLGWQMTLNFDTQLFDYQGVAAGELNHISENNFGESDLEHGNLTSAWFSPKAISVVDDAILFTLYFSVKKAASTLENVLKITSDITPAFGFDASKNKFTPQIIFAKNTIVPPVSVNFELSQNRPNPFNDETFIGFTLPESTDATFSIFDAAGKLMQTSTNFYDKGRHEIRLNRTDLPTNGVYFYEIRTNQTTARRRMVVVE